MVMTENLIQSVLAVDQLDQPLDVMEKHKAPRNGILHRAFSIFLFRSSGSSFQVLLQQTTEMLYQTFLEKIADSIKSGFFQASLQRLIQGGRL
ncbi:MAG: hypothetical protein EB051_00160 [Chlamydiia bacterium]|jgi:isopentenyldiphosphate isomerase|nr:hypothetical protein [Chlamydiia bacterium]